MSNLKSILLIALILLNVCVMSAQKAVNIDKTQIKLVWNKDKVSLYDHEPTVLTLHLWTPAYEIRGVRQSKSPELVNGKFSYLQRADFNPEPKIVEENGRMWYVYPIDSYAVAMDRPGKYTLKGGRYVVDIAVPKLYEDPYWGKMQTIVTERIEVPVGTVQFAVQELPSNEKESEFSGAVGDFKVDVVIPPGDIYLNEEALAIVTVVGPGWLDSDTLPEYHDAFGQGTKLKSFSESRRQYIRDGELVSELQMECTFIPTSRENAVIGPIWIEVFNPETGKYEIVKSESAQVKVQSIAEKAPALDI